MEKLPILLGDLEVGMVVIQKPTNAINAARDAAFNISRTKDAQLCPFSDGSHLDGRGGVGLVCRRQWLPDGWTSDQTGTHPNGDFFKQAWAYTHSNGSTDMEGIGVLEAIHAANKTIARDLHVLKAHNCTVTVRVTTDCVSMLRLIASQRPVKKKARKTVLTQLVKRIKEEMQMLQGYGIKVTAELHWCPRNKVAQLTFADELARDAMYNGLGFSNATQKIWSEDIKSDMAGEIEAMRTDDLPDPAPEANDPRTELPKNTTRKSRKARKRERRRARQAESTATSTNDSEPQPQLPLPKLTLPSEPGKSTPLQTPLKCWHDWWFSPSWNGY